MKILQNVIQCNHCKDVLVSYHVHDFKTCKCGKVSIDGGFDYLRRVFEKEEDFTDYSKTDG